MQVAKKHIYVSAGLVVGFLLLKLWLLDVLVEFGIKDQTSLRKRNEIRDIYLKIPFPLDFKIYFFNVTNPMEIQSGAKPILKEMGPYSYDEFKEKIDVVDNETEDSLTYTPYDIYKFNQNKSGSLSDEDEVTIIHPLLVGMVNQVVQDAPVFLSIVNQSIEHLFHNPQSIFVTAKVKDILFDGVEISCKSKDFSTTAVCGQMKTKIPGLKVKQGDEDTYLFSLLGSRNATKTKRVKILRGINQSKDLGTVLEVDGEKEISLWSTVQCNRFNGTDGWIFPPLLRPEEGLKSFSTELCRNVMVHYVNDTVMKNLNIRIYEGDLGDQSTDEEEKCYCPTPDSCLKKGLYDLSKCMGVPIITSLPHFYKTDESYLSKVDGLEPDAKKHGLMAAFEPMTGTPIKAAKRLQFNIEIQANKKVRLFLNLPTGVLFPMMWVEESVDLEGYLLKKLQTIFLLLKVVDIMLYVTIIVGVIAFAAAVYYHQKNNKEVTITPVYEIKKMNDGDHEDDDVQKLTRNRETNGKTGHVNPVMADHDFDRY